MNRSQWQFTKTLLMLTDSAVTVLSFFTAYFLRNIFFKENYGNLQGLDVYLWMLAVIIPLWPFLLNTFHVYELKYNKNVYKSARIIIRLFPSVIFGDLFLTSVFYFTGRLEISRLFFLIFAIVNLLMLWITKLIINLYWHRKTKSKSNSKKVLVVTDSTKNYFTDYINNNPHLLIDIIGYVKATEKPLNTTKRVLGNINQLINILKTSVVDEVVFDLPNQKIDDFENLFLECEKMGISVSLVVHTFDLKIATTDVELLGTVPLLTFKTTDFSYWQMFLKRLIDICAGIVGLFITAIAFVFIAPAIKIDSVGPILFGQNRMGRNGRIFKFYKFRSMYKDAEDRKKQLMEQNEITGHMFKMTNDPRITKVGKFLRRTSLDELPQFWNILKGDMSLVGTRPPTLDEVNKYETYHFRRLSIKPGLTGIWQVSGRSKILDFDDVVKLDLEYIDNWSIWLDIKIIFKTFLVVFKMKGSK